MSSTILVVTPDFPYPPNHGGRVDYFNRIKYLHQLGLEIHLISTVGEPVSDEHLLEMKRYVATIEIVRRQNKLAHLFSVRPFQMRSRDELASMNLDRQTYDFILLEGEYVVPIFKNKQLRFGQSFLRVHNHESRYFTSLATAAFPKMSALYYLMEAVKFKRILPGIHKQFDKLLYISSSECETSTNPKKALHLLPVYADEGLTKNFVQKSSSTVLFLGSLFMPNNQKGLDFFIQRVHPQLVSLPGYKLLVAGSTKRDKRLQRSIIKRYEGLSNIHFHFDVSEEQMDSLYEQASAFVNPIFHGAGVKMKVLEAIRNGLPVVSTSEGVSGTGFRNGTEVLIADNADEMRKALTKILNGEVNAEKLVTAAREKINSSTDQLVRLFNNSVTVLA